MNIRLIKIGDKKYINPYYIISIYQRSLGTSNIWYVRMRDGAEWEIGEGYIQDLIRELT